MTRAGALRLPLILLPAFFLQFLPLPGWLATARPLWIPAVLVAWALTSREPRGLASAWIAGLLLDVAYGSVLGQHALGLTLVVFAVLQLRSILALFPVWQEAAALTLVWLLYAFLMFWIDGATGHQADPWMRWLPVLTTGVSWPLVMVTLNASRRGSAAESPL